ncbi:hypothetical protein SAMN04488134_101581 [Amphibacillus marinus]|uniref:DUF6884 domain-containing protein n=1 Tax=Amphibacillus marinus TaxID=872970 RepID=A0A1H8ICG4_9BACI|nr:DUF6884 domain-containing protein [Amphibacillus marinus]SEN66031.1 hypothetical protein SAMN04488134_101581 [Amphibacillus marinus]
MRELAIIPCGKRKIWDVNPTFGQATVNEAYIGTLHRLTKQYAQTFCDNWVILSAKHGYCFGDEIIPSNYDLTFGMNNKQAIISNEKLKAQIHEKELLNCQKIIVLTGQKHKRVVEASFEEQDRLFFPLIGGRGIGDMQQKLKQALVLKRPFL